MIKRNLVLIIIIFLYSLLTANENTFIDNYEIQLYKGKLGKWQLLNSRNNINFFIKKYGISKKQVYSINNKNFKTANYLFFPYSKKYLDKIKNKFGDRKIVPSLSGYFIWPMGDVEKITSFFGVRLGEMHTGIDLPANRGTPIIAAMDGRVIFSSYAGGHGNSIYIEHRENYFTRYSHNSVMFVKKGEYVKKGQIIGLVGSTGNSTGNHLHFEIRYNDIPLNPIDFLSEKTFLNNE